LDHATASQFSSIGLPDLEQCQQSEFGVSPIDGQWGILGQGGYSYTNAGGSWHIAGGVVDMDAYENWDPIIGNGNPSGTFDFFTVAVHEAGHALGLDHSSNGNDLMYSYYTGEKVWASATDVANIQSLYGAWASNGGTGKFAYLEAVPEPSTIALIGIGLIILALTRRGISPSRQAQSHIM
jgi:hypothetical protein